MLQHVPAEAARRLLLSGQGLLGDPERRASTASVARLVEQLGFVQVDSIHRVERAHHLILGARLDHYRPELLDRLAFRERALFEHWTHAAAYIPIALFPHWKPRFAARAQEMRRRPWYKRRLGAQPERTIARVLARVAREGPLRAADFERRADRPSTGWWDWTPEKTALEVLWFTGRLAIAGRDGFEKIYDLVERVLPDAHAAPAPTSAKQVEWACSSALERLGAATRGELVEFWRAVKPGEAAAWCRRAVSEGRAVSVALGSARGGKPLAGVALPDWETRARRAPEPPDALRLLAPFDPILRDRERAARLFDFDYQFEAYVPAPKRRYGYYVLPILERDRFVGRLDPRHDRARGALVVEGLWWEPRVRATKARRRALERALEKLARRIGARSVELSARAACS
ncbi:MAG TPA: crosslink repair DNA glycosylase YcaQ family protein [Myxococcota bacterium]|nr:crosslink repair DNA glycosylase YcaQ family protein [Myxococcota bacterium]